MPPEFRMMDVKPQNYLYVEGASDPAPENVSKAMGDAFGKVMGFMQSHGIAPAGPAMSAYYDYDPKEMRFRSGFVVNPDALAEAEGEIKSDSTPGGRVLHFTHVGPYSTLRDDYGALMAYCETEGLKVTAPTWELYVDDPHNVPEEDLRTEVYVSVA